MENKTYDYGCVMLQLPIKKEIWSEIQSFINEDDIEYNDDLGRETDPHITLLYGIHADVNDSDVENVINNFEPKEILLHKLDCFENDLYDVLIFKIIDNIELSEMNESLKNLPHTNSYPDYKPHCTIAYLKKGLGKKYADEINLGVKYKVKTNLIKYSKPNGDKKHYSI